MFFDNVRNSVNAILSSMEGQPVYSENATVCTASSIENGGAPHRPLKTFVGVAGADQRTGRTSVHPEYAQKLLTSKIVVVAQRDEWVGHYRLLEALVSGALVLADVTQDLPKGLRHGQSLLVYHTLAEMRDLILYYLHHSDERKRIATRGWEIAMGYHRSWHVMESLVFGDPVFQVNQAYPLFATEIGSQLMKQDSHLLTLV